MIRIGWLGLGAMGGPMAACLARGGYQVRSALDIFVKDMGLVGAAAGDAGADTPLARAAAQLYQRGHDLGLGGLDDSAVLDVLRAQFR